MDNVVLLCGDCNRNEPGHKKFLQYQKRGGSFAWLFRQMSSERRVEYTLFWPLVVPSAANRHKLQKWWEKRDRAMKRAGYDHDKMNDWNVTFHNWQGC